MTDGFSFRDIVRLSSDAVMVTAIATQRGEGPQIVYINNAFSEITGLTETAGILMGAPAETGRLVESAPADFVVWDGSPLDLCRKPISVIVGGRHVADSKAD